MRNIAIILAGGSGTRVGGDTPKQFIHVAGKQIIQHSIEAFERCERIDEICIVCREDYIDYMHELVQTSGYTKVRKILNGGKERYHSSVAAIQAYTDDNDNLLFHDAVRPMVSERIINDCIDALSRYNAVDVAVKTTDTIIAVDAEGCITDTPDRTHLRNVQTPQGFKRRTIRLAYEKALADPNLVTTDDCGTVCKYLPEEPIYVVEGENTNIKLTYREDLLLLEILLTNNHNQTSVL